MTKVITNIIMTFSDSITEKIITSSSSNIANSFTQHVSLSKLWVQRKNRCSDVIIQINNLDL